MDGRLHDGLPPGVPGAPPCPDNFCLDTAPDLPPSSTLCIMQVYQTVRVIFLHVYQAIWIRRKFKAADHLRPQHVDSYVFEQILPQGPERTG